MVQVRGDVVGFERLAVDLDEEVGIAVAPRWQRDVIDGGTALTRTEVEACVSAPTTHRLVLLFIDNETTSFWESTHWKVIELPVRSSADLLRIYRNFIFRRIFLFSDTLADRTIHQFVSAMWI